MKEIEKRIQEISEQQRKLAIEKDKLQNELANILCPFNVGDVGEVMGYSYKGSKAQVIEIKKSWSSWVVVLGVFNKNGKLGNRTTEIHNENDFTVEHKNED